jgi:hypothetical protein
MCKPTLLSGSSLLHVVRPTCLGWGIPEKFPAGQFFLLPVSQSVDLLRLSRCRQDEPARAGSNVSFSKEDSMSQRNKTAAGHHLPVYGRLLSLLLAAGCLALSAVQAQAQCVTQPPPNFKYWTELGGRSSFAYANSVGGQFRGRLYFKLYGRVQDGRLVVDGEIRREPEPGGRNQFTRLYLDWNARYGVNGAPTVRYCSGAGVKQLTIDRLPARARYARTGAKWVGLARLEITFSDTPGGQERFRVHFYPVALQNSDPPNPAATSGEWFNAVLLPNSDFEYLFLR